MLLSIDTFSDILGLSLIDGHKLILRLSYGKVKPFSELLISKIDGIFRETGYSLSDLYGVAVNVGPGSYTGLRVGITVAKTIAYAQKVKLFSYPSLHAVAFRHRYCGGKMLVGIYAGQGGLYSRFQPVGGECGGGGGRIPP